MNIEIAVNWDARAVNSIDLGFAITYHFPDAQPDVNQAQAAKSSAHKGIRGPETYRGVIQQQVVLRPDVGPGENQQGDTQLQADENEYQQSQTAGPKLAAGKALMLGRWRLLFRRHRAAGRVAFRLAGLVSQASPALPGHIRMKIHAAVS